MSSASATVTVAARTSSVRPDLSCIWSTTSNMPASASSSAWMTTSTPSPSTLRSGSVTSAATSINLSLSRARPVISQSIHTRRSHTGYTLCARASLAHTAAKVAVVSMPSAVQRRTPLRVVTVLAVIAVVVAGHLWYGNRHDYFDLRIYYGALITWSHGAGFCAFPAMVRYAGPLGFTNSPSAA